jgi:hypothetical protein
LPHICKSLRTHSSLCLLTAESLLVCVLHVPVHLHSMNVPEHKSMSSCDHDKILVPEQIVSLLQEQDCQMYCS